MIERKFFSVPEAMERFGVNALDLGELVEFHGLRFYVRVSNVRAKQMDGVMDDSLRESGQHELYRWRFSKKEFDGEEDSWNPIDDESFYLLNGWMELTESATTKLLSGRETIPLDFASHKAGKRLGAFIATDASGSIEDARIRSSDLAAIRDRSLGAAKTRLPTQMRADKEENLLRIIAVLWSMTELDRKPTTAASRLRDELALWSVEKPEKDTIANALTQAAALAKGKHPKFG